MAQTPTIKSKGKRNTPKSAKGQALVITRIFDASRERVWQEWTDPERVKHWWGPAMFTAPVIEIDFRVGGKYLYAMRGPDGKDYWSTGIFRKIVPLKRIELTDSFADEKGNVVPATYYGMAPDFALESKVTVTFEDVGSKTKLTIRYVGVPANNLKDAESGWNTSLDKLAADLA